MDAYFHKCPEESYWPFFGIKSDSVFFSVLFNKQKINHLAYFLNNYWTRKIEKAIREKLAKEGISKYYWAGKVSAKGITFQTG